MCILKHVLNVFFIRFVDLHDLDELLMPLLCEDYHQEVIFVSQPGREKKHEEEIK